MQTHDNDFQITSYLKNTGRKQTGSQSNKKKLIGVIILGTVFITIEIIGGIISHSISVISDAAHLITDVIGFVISYAAIEYSKKKANNKFSFGFHRVEIVGAIINLFTIWAIAIDLLMQATTRIVNKQFVQEPKIMLYIAVGGLGVNIFMFFILHSGSGHSHGLGSKCSHNHGTQNQHKVQSMTDSKFSEICLDHSHSYQTQKKLTSCDTIVEHQHNQNCSHDHHDHSHSNQTTKQQQITIDDTTTSNTETKHQRKCSHEHKDQSSDQHINKPLQPHNHNHDHSHTHTHTEKDHENMSMKAAVLHVITDIIQSVGLVISSIIIYIYGSNNGQTVTQFNSWHYLDPIATYIFSILVLFSTYPISKQCYEIILQSTPSDIDSNKIRQDFSNTPGVKAVHDFHIWQHKPGKVLLSAHIFSKQQLKKQVLQSLTKQCRSYNIFHSTIQVQQWDQNNLNLYIKSQNDIH